MTSSDARRHARLHIALPARVASLDPDRNPRTGTPAFRIFDALTTDISDGGLALSALDDLGSGRRVLVELELPDGSSVELVGRIVWLEPQKEPGLPARMGIALSQQSCGLVERANVTHPLRSRCLLQ
jgi:Tfp pilus assembly protein PilZ